MVLSGLNITTEFRKVALPQGYVFDAFDNRYPINSRAPLFYLLERGPEPGSFDSALLDQARNLDVDVRFNTRAERFSNLGILASAPKAADAIAVGYHFDTDMANGFWAICDDHLAPKGYAYLLVMDGKGTVKSCMFSDFKREHDYVARTVGV